MLAERGRYGRVPRVSVTAGPWNETAIASLSRRWTGNPTTRRDTTVADDSMALLETLRKATGGGDVDVLREGVRVPAQRSSSPR